MKINKSKYLFRKLQSKMIPVKDLSKKEIFRLIKPSLIGQFEEYLSTVYISTGQKRPTKNNYRGPSRTYNLNQFFEILFAWLDNGLKASYIKEKYKDRGGGSFFRYLSLLCQSGLIFKLFSLSSLTADKSQLFVIDSFMVKSIDGKECTGKNYLDRGRRGTKVTLITNPNKIITQILITPANQSEVYCLQKILENKGFKRELTLLSDRGYYGKAIINQCKQQGIKLLMEPKQISNRKIKKPRTFICKGCKINKICTASKTCSKNYKYLEEQALEPKIQYTHNLTTHENNLLRKHRNKIEHINGEIRRFRATNLKYVRSIRYYSLLVTLGALLTNIFHNGFY